MSLTTLFAVVLLPVLLGLIGLVADGGEVLVARRQVQGLAESAAHVHVTSRSIPMTFLRLAGIMQVQVAADATAVPRTGVASAQR